MAYPLKKELRKNKNQTLNVGEEINFVSPQDSVSVTENPPPANSVPEKLSPQLSKAKNPNLRADMLDSLTAALVNELGDRGSEKRHRQLLDICERNGLDELAKKALIATRRRLAQEQEQGVLEKPGAYYQKILIGFLEDHQVFVPPAGSKDEQAEVRRLARQSLEQAARTEA